MSDEKEASDALEKISEEIKDFVVAEGYILTRSIENGLYDLIFYNNTAKMAMVARLDPAELMMAVALKQN